MAKLPDIKYNQVAKPKTLDPSIAAVEYRQKQAVYGAVQKLGMAVEERASEYESVKANAAYADDVANTMRDIAAHQGPVSAEDVRQMGIDDMVKVTDANGEDRTDIAPHEWRTALLNRRIADAKEKHAGNITMPGRRKGWEARVDEANRKMITQQFEQDAKSAEQYYSDKAMGDAAQAIAMGNYHMAREMVGIANLDPKATAEQILKIDQTEANANLALYKQNASPEQLREKAVELRSKDAVKNSPLTADQLSAQADNMESLATVRENEIEKKKTKAVDLAVNTYFAENYNNPEALLANLPSMVVTEYGESPMQAADIRAIVNFAKKSSTDTLTTDPILYNDIYTQILEDPKAWMASGKRVRQYVDKMAPSAYQTLLKLEQAGMASMQGDVKDFARTASTSAQIKSLLPSIGLDSSKDDDAAKIFVFNALATQALQAASLNPDGTTRELSPAEETKVLNDLSVKMQGELTAGTQIWNRYLSEVPFVGGWKDQNREEQTIVDYVSQNNISLEDSQAIYQVLSEMGLDPTVANFDLMYKASNQ